MQKREHSPSRTRRQEIKKGEEITEILKEINEKLDSGEFEVEELENEFKELRNEIEREIKLKETRDNLAVKFNKVQDKFVTLVQEREKGEKTPKQEINKMETDEINSGKIKVFWETTVPQIQKLQRKIEEEILNSAEVEKYRSWQKKLEEQWQTARDLYTDLLKAGINREEIVEQMERLDDKTRELREKLQSEINTPLPALNLPKYTIPCFYGDYEKWPEFYDGFSALINSENRLTKVEKMKHLKTHVKGEAGRLIQHMAITETNYDEAWEMLKSRYQNERLIIQKLIEKMLDTPNIEIESAKKLKQLYNEIQETRKLLENLKIETESWDPIMSVIIQRKLDRETRRLYEQSLDDSHKVQKLNTLMKFIKTRFESLEVCTNENRKIIQHEWRKPVVLNNEQYTARGRDMERRAKHTMTCICCGRSHRIQNCNQFIAMRVPERISFIRKKKYCIKCLEHEDRLKCGKLWPGKHLMLQESKERPSTNQEKPRSSNMTVELKNEKQIVLATAIIKAKTLEGTYEFLRVLIDTGAQASLITEQAAQVLGLPRYKNNIEVTGVGNTPKLSKNKIYVEIKPRFVSSFSVKTEALILGKLTQAIPQKPFDGKKEQWKNDWIADPEYNKPGEIDMILGVQVYTQVMKKGMRKTDEGLLGQETEFGWIMSGEVVHNKTENMQVCTSITEIGEKPDIAKFWEIEEIQSERKETVEEEYCENLYRTTTKRGEDGRYTVRVPFKESKNELCASKPIALSRFFQMEMKLNKDIKLKKEYIQFMAEYEELGHMKKVSITEKNKGKYYIPHQPVVREESTTTKLRVVFDASAKTKSGISLNEAMYAGPKLQADLAEILLRWRTHRIAYIADLEKMYRQIRIAEIDQPYHRIIWRPSTENKLQEYQMTTLTYGTTAAPFLAIRTIQQLAEDEKKKYPKAAKIAKRSFYMDDLLDGENSVTGAIQAQEELINMMKTGGFNLRKWHSNSKEILKNLPNELKEESLTEISEDETKKTLGIHWAPVRDILTFKVQVTRYEKVTKRKILSEVAKIYDPLGIISPVTVAAKLLIQEIWSLKIGWDEELPKNIIDKWNRWINELNHLEEIALPRWTMQSTESKSQLHGFCDATPKAYGAVIYVRTEINGIITIRLLTAKSKVAPLQAKLTLPKMELCAAALLSKLMQKILRIMESTKIDKVTTWSDSMVSLAWIKGEPNKWKTFVSNRVSDIKKEIPQAEWNYIDTKENPADIISRGISPEKINKHKLWWYGPTWLTKPEEEWPQEKTKIETREEEKIIIHVAAVKQKNSLDEIINKFSSLTKLFRVTAYCQRFINRTLHKQKGDGNIVLTTEEIHNARSVIVRHTQAMEFQTEIANLTKNEAVNGNSKLKNLTPFLDENKILRVGGRLRNANIPWNAKHPVIIPYKSNLATLIIENAHKTMLHAGKQATHSYIRQTYWIINAKRSISAHIQKCTTCIRYKKEPAQQLMGDLPAVRVNPALPFENTGVDYAGPIMVRKSRGRGQKTYKGYIVVFVCLATKAIHLEVAGDLTTATFLAAYHRFTARRGKCSNIYSDNGTNFVGAEKIFQKEVKNTMRDEKVQEKMATNGVQWHFIPANSPNFGGIWESAVKSMKHHLRRVLGETKLTFEELNTVICQIEACLNTRPLLPINEDSPEEEILTPGHFLVGRSLMQKNTMVTEELNSNNVTIRWKMIQQIKKNFWKAWKRDYLNQLQQRYKWSKPAENLKPGEIVLIKEESSPGKWPLAKITETHTGRDDRVRVVTMEKSGGAQLKRAVSKVVPLKIQSEVEKSKQIKEKSTKGLGIATIMTMLLLLCVCPVKSSFNITNPPAGFYIEHLGHTQIDRGALRIEIEIDKNRLQTDQKRTIEIIRKINGLCEEIKGLTDESECENLVHYLQVWGDKIRTMYENINMTHVRHKRGVLGKFLTAVFGVNEEVYQNIDSLDKNQQKIIQMSQKQTKFMLTTLAAVNETETRITKKLKKFEEKLTECKESIEQMSFWYSRINSNTLNIHVITVYQTALGFLEEVMEKQEKIFKLMEGYGHFNEIISRRELKKKIKIAEEKLPNSIQILETPVLSTNVENAENKIKICGHFPIVEKSEFELVKIEPIPVKIEKEAYWTLDINEDEILATDFNNLRYFTITVETLKNSRKLGPEKYLVFPAVIRNMESSPNCATNKIFKRDKDNCKLKKHILKASVWKQLFQPNAWLFINSGETQIAVICNGQREEILLNKTGIITITQDCLIETRQSLIAPRLEDKVQVISKFVKEVKINTDITKLEQNKEEKSEKLVELSNKFQEAKKLEERIQEELNGETWRKITNHANYIGIGYTGLTILLIGGIIISYKFIKQYRNNKKKEKETEMKEKEDLLEKGNSSDKTEYTVELKPLNTQEIRMKIDAAANTSQKIMTTAEN